MNRADRFEVRIEPRENLMHSVYVRKLGYSEGYVGEAFTMVGARRRAKQYIRNFDPDNSYRYIVEAK